MWMKEHHTIMIRTKLNAPTITRKIIKREKILQKLAKSTGFKLTLITAPAGFGKTTAVVGYLAETRQPFAWLSVDEGDNDPVRFWRYLLASFRGLGNFADDFWDIPVNQELIAANIQADLLLDKLYMLSTKTVVVIDDYHLICNRVVQNSLAYLIKYLPSHFRMMILSRKELEVKFIREYAGGQLFKLGFRDLAFDYQEVVAFFAEKGYQLPSETVTAIWKYTEGWPAGLVVTAFSLEDNGAAPQRTVSRFSRKDYHLDRYLSDEVFARWPDEVRDFLVRIAFLNKFCGPLCQAVTGLTDSAALLNKLAANNGFIFHLDYDNEWFRFHHLFSDFLRRRLAREIPDFRRQLYQRAGEWYRENGLRSDAITAFIKAGGYGQALPLLMELYYQMADNGEFAAWLELMGQIPAQYPQENVRACTEYSWMLSMENRIDEARSWAERAQSCFDRVKDELTGEQRDYMEAHVMIVKANLAIYEINIDRVTHYLRQADRCQLAQHLCIGEMNSGEISLLKSVYGLRGRLKQAAQLYDSLLDIVRRVIGNYAAYSTVILAECRYEWNNLKSAQQILARGMEEIIGLQSPGVIVPCMITLAKIKRVQGDFDGAIRTIDLGRKKLVGKSKLFWNYYFDLFTAGLCLDRQEAAAAAEWLNLDRIGIFDSLSRSREYEHIIYARYLNLLGRSDEALLLLDRLDDFARKEDRLGSRIEILCQIAISHQSQGDPESAMLALDNALDLGMANGYVRTFVDQLEPMAELLITYKNWKKKAATDPRYNYAKSLFRLVRENIRIFRTKLLEARDVPPQLPTGQQLTVRELRVLRLLAAERSNREIAAELCISVRTVKHHNSQIFVKLGVENRREAVKRAWEIGILE
jgi:LuxR family maltose regulon positive regulatory protein